MLTPSGRQFGNVRKLYPAYEARHRGPDGKLLLAPGTFQRKADAARWLSLKEAEISTGEWIAPELGRRSSASTPDDGCAIACSRRARPSCTTACSPITCSRPSVTSACPTSTR